MQSSCDHFAAEGVHCKLAASSCVFQDEFDEGENAEILEVTGGQEEAAGSIRSVRSDALELIHPNDVAKALREFVSQHSKPTK